MPFRKQFLWAQHVFPLFNLSFNRNTKNYKSIPSYQITIHGFFEEVSVSDGDKLYFCFYFTKGTHLCSSVASLLLQACWMITATESTLLVKKAFMNETSYLLPVKMDVH